MTQEPDKIYLTLTDDTEVECNILGTFEVDELEYIALVPIDEEEVLLYRFQEKGDNLELINIEDDEEFEMVSEAFYTLFVEEDIDFIADEE